MIQILFSIVFAIMLLVLAFKIAGSLFDAGERIAEKRSEAHDFEPEFYVGISCFFIFLIVLVYGVLLLVDIRADHKESLPPAAVESAQEINGGAEA